jgi:hypothetical protein
MRKTLKRKKQKGGNIVVQSDRLGELQEIVANKLNLPYSSEDAQKGAKLISEGYSGFIFEVNVPEGFVINTIKRTYLTKLYAKVVVLSDERLQYTAGDKPKKFELVSDLQTEVRNQNEVYENSLVQLGYPLTVRVIDSFTMKTWGKMEELRIEKHKSITGFAVILMPFAGITFLDYIKYVKGLSESKRLDQRTADECIRNAIKMIRLKKCELEMIGFTHKDLHWKNVCVEVSATNPPFVDHVFIIDFGMVNRSEPRWKSFFYNLLSRYHQNPHDFVPSREEQSNMMNYFLVYSQENIQYSGEKEDGSFKFLENSLENNQDPKRFFPTEPTKKMINDQLFSSLANYSETSATVPNYNFAKSVRVDNLAVPVNQVLALQQRTGKLEIALQTAFQRINQLEKTRTLPAESFPPQQGRSVWQKLKFWGGKTLKKKLRRVRRSHRLRCLKSR